MRYQNQVPQVRVRSLDANLGLPPLTPHSRHRRAFAHIL
jgi:hypothetical protein